MGRGLVHKKARPLINAIKGKYMYSMTWYAIEQEYDISRFTLKDYIYKITRDKLKWEKYEDYNEIKDILPDFIKDVKKWKE